MTTTVPSPEAGTRARRRKGLIAGGLGNALEWYDWNAYAVFSVFIAANFFPDGAGVTGRLQTLLVFAVGFFFRPLGGLLLSAVADRFGRRAGLILTVGLMASGALLIAVAPTYHQIGLGAPVLLLIARIAQGLSTGGEFATTSSYLAELAPKEKRGRYSSVVYISTTIGTMAAVTTSLILRTSLTPTQLTSWGWRIPFILGALGGLVTFFIRRTMAESEAFTGVRTEARRAGLFDGIRRHPKASSQIFGVTVGITVWFYTFAVYLPSSAKAANPAAARSIDIASLAAQTLFCLVLPFFGWASDRYGRRLSLLSFCWIGVVTAVPLLTLMEPNAGRLFIVQTLALLVFACYGAMAPTMMSEMFPTEVRTAGIGFPYAMAVAMFGGTAPYLLEWMTAHSLEDLFPWYVAALCVVSLLVGLTMRESRHTELSDIGKGSEQLKVALVHGQGDKGHRQ